jgi:hypothetical protein
MSRKKLLPQPKGQKIVSIFIQLRVVVGKSRQPGEPDRARGCIFRPVAFSSPICTDA